jgi:hypothetical protein
VEGYFFDVLIYIVRNVRVKICREGGCWMVEVGVGGLFRKCESGVSSWHAIICAEYQL